MIDKDTKLSVREFILIVTTLLTAMSSWIPRLTAPAVTPEVTELKTEVSNNRNELIDDERIIQDLHYRVRELEKQKGYGNNDDPDIYNSNGSRRHPTH